MPSLGPDPVRLALSGRTLSVTNRHGAQALVDTRTFAVTRPGPPRWWASLTAPALYAG